MYLYFKIQLKPKLLNPKPCLKEVKVLTESLFFNSKKRKQQGGWFCWCMGWWMMLMACLAIFINEWIHCCVARNSICILDAT